MPAKEYTFDNGLTVRIFKRRGNRNLRLTITPTGQVRVSIPAWAPYRAGVEFAKTRMDWIISQRKHPAKLVNGQAIGKAHHLSLQPTLSATNVTTRLSSSVIVVRYPLDMTETNSKVQSAAQVASIRALRSQAEKLLPQRLADLARTQGFEYKSVKIKRLKGRWGSCDSQKNIVLNLFLMQLPWELIDYVLFHELVHTRVLKHGPDFWAEMEHIIPNSKLLRKQLREYQPVLDGLG